MEELRIINNNELVNKIHYNSNLINTNYVLEAFKRFIEYYKDKKPTTIKAYSKNIVAFSKWLQENNIHELPTRDDIINFRDYLKSTNHKATTINSYMNTLRQLFNFLTSEGVYNKNPYDNIKSLKLSKEFRKEALSLDQIKKVMAQFKRDTIKSKRDYAILCLLFCCGLRTIEIERALIEDLDLEKNILHIQGKGRDEKTDYVKLPLELQEAIIDYLKTRKDLKASEPLFTSESNNSIKHGLDKGSISRIVKTSFRNVGLNSPKLTAHSCRHTTATLNLLNGGTLEETRELLRHTTIATTMIYAHIIDREKNKSEERIANLIFSNNQQ